MRLDLRHQQPLRGGGTDRTGHWKQLQEDKSYLLLAGVLDPSERAAAAPVSPITLTDTKLRTYNEILRHVESLSDRYYRKGGYVECPETFTSEEQQAVSNDISDVGCHIYELFHGARSPVRPWLDRLLEHATNPRGGSASKEDRPVTIVTNDFSIPWYWLKRETFGPSLCEVCSLGMLQLRAAIGTARDRRDETKEILDAEVYRALLVNASGELPFSDDETDGIKNFLQSPSKYLPAFQVKRVSSAGDLADVEAEFDEEVQLENEFRIVHFSGHYSGNDLLIDGRRLPERYLDPFIKDSLLVLDGCSSASGLKAWTDVEGLTSKLINAGGAVGCVATILPVKNDPIVSREFWSAFYSHLRSRTCSVGYALARARLELKRHFNEIGSPNPTWLLYQLIGSPVVRLIGEEEHHD